MGNLLFYFSGAGEVFLRQVLGEAFHTGLGVHDAGGGDRMGGFLRGEAVGYRNLLKQDVCLDTGMEQQSLSHNACSYAVWNIFCCCHGVFHLSGRECFSKIQGEALAEGSASDIVLGLRVPYPYGSKQSVFILPVLTGWRNRDEVVEKVCFLDDDRG